MLPAEQLPVQGLHRAVRFYRPARLADRPPLVVALHGSGGTGERFRRLTAAAFDRLADEHGFLVAYPDGLGGQWHDCRATAPYRAALAGVDDVAFVRAIVGRAREMTGKALGATFVVGYSNGGHLAFRLALEAPGEFAALAVIGAHLPVEEERACGTSSVPVSMFLVSGTDDPINPYAGGEVRRADGLVLGRVLAAAQTAEYFRARAGATSPAAVEAHPDRDPGDGTRVETLRWKAAAGSHEVVLMVVHGGGHALPHPDAVFPADIVGRTSRDIDGAAAIWRFFAGHLERR